MKRILDLLIPSNKYWVNDAKENATLYSLNIVCNEKVEICEEILAQVKSVIPDKDSCTIRVQVNDSDFVPLSLSNSDNWSDTIDDLNFYYEEETFIEKIKISIEISKNTSFSVSIYDIDLYTKHLVENTLINLLSSFKDIMNSDFQVYYDTVNDEVEFHTSLFNCRQYSGNTSSHKAYNTRSTEIAKVNQNVNFRNESEYPFYPLDFHLKHQNNLPTSLIEIFAKLKILYSLISIADYSELKDDYLFCQIKGYRNLKWKIPFASLDSSALESYFKVYLWVYEDGSVVDKLGLARNIISIHLKDFSSPHLQGDVLGALQSGFNIYQKDNIKQYLQLKTNLDSQLASISVKASEITSEYIKTFKNSSVALLSYFGSIIVVRSIIQDADIIFTRDIAIISFIFIIIMAVFAILNSIEVILDKRLLKSQYDEVKSRYEDLLDSADILRIFKNDYLYNLSVKNINSKFVMYVCLWIVMIISLLVTVFSLSEFTVTSIICNLFKIAIYITISM